MNTTELSQKSDAQLIEKANEYLSHVDDAGGLDKPHLLIRGQFYLDEVARRQQAKQHREERALNYFELLLTIVIVVMIGRELKDSGQQQRLLSAMNDNSLKQTQLIGSLIEQQKAALETVARTNETAQRQLQSLESEQQSRLAEAGKHPIVKMALGEITSEQLQKNSIIPIKVEMPNGTDSAYARMAFIVENTGTFPLQQGSFLALASPDSVTLNAAATRGFNLLHKNAYSTGLVEILPHSKRNVEIDVMPNGQKNFEIHVAIEGARMSRFESTIHFVVIQ